MKIINSIKYDLEWTENPNKTIYLVKLKGRFYVWIQDSVHPLSDSQIIGTAEGIFDIKVAVSKFELYKELMDDIYVDNTENIEH
jgi:hypothetical protein